MFSDFMDTNKQLKSTRKRLLQFLGTEYDNYVDAVQKWFEKKITRKELDRKLRARLSPTQLRLHNEFMLALIANISDTRFFSPNPIENVLVSKKKKDPANDREVNTMILQEELSYKAVNEQFLPDDTSIYGRFIMSVWGNEVEHIDEAACKLIVTASTMFIKNILSAVIGRKTGFKVHRGKLMYNYGMPVPNPWLMSTANYNCEANYSIKVGETEDGFHVKIPDYKKVEQDILFQLSSTSTKNYKTQKSPICIDDMIDALKIHKHLIASGIMYSSFMQKLLLSRYHPSWDDLGS